MVKNPVVELDGDEMTRIIWKKIREKVLYLLDNPHFLDVELTLCALRHLDLGLEYHDAVRSLSVFSHADDAVFAYRPTPLESLRILPAHVPRPMTE